jgi:hypothetical protein
MQIVVRLCLQWASMILPMIAAYYRMNTRPTQYAITKKTYSRLEVPHIHLSIMITVLHSLQLLLILIIVVLVLLTPTIIALLLLILHYWRPCVCVLRRLDRAWIVPIKPTEHRQSPLQNLQLASLSAATCSMMSSARPITVLGVKISGSF